MVTLKNLNSNLNLKVKLELLILVSDIYYQLSQYYTYCLAIEDFDVFFKV